MSNVSHREKKFKEMVDKNKLKNKRKKTKYKLFKRIIVISIVNRLLVSIMVHVVSLTEHIYHFYE